jgi:hypothetical protein
MCARLTVSGQTPRAGSCENDKNQKVLKRLIAAVGWGVGK